MLSGCDDLPTTSVIKHVANPWDFAQTAMPLPLLVLGRPFEAPEDRIVLRTAQLTAEAMTWTATGAVWPIGPTEAAGGIHLTLFYNGAAVDPCRPKDGGGKPQPNGRVDVRLYLCDGGDVLAYVIGHVGRSRGLDDWRFSALLRQATSDLLRPQSRQDP